MVMANITTALNLEEVLCSAEFREEIHDHLMWLIVFTIFLSFTAILENTLILVVLHKDSSLHPPSKLLIFSIVSTDLFAGIVREPLAVVVWTSMISERWKICRYAFISLVVSGSIFGCMSFLTVTAVSVDRFLALSLGFRYRQVVTIKRSYTIVTLFWIASIVSSVMYLQYNVVTFRYTNIFAALCLIITVIAYTKIFLTLRKRQSHVQDAGQTNQVRQASKTRYTRSLTTALWLLLALAVCYLPQSVMLLLVTQSQTVFSSFVLVGQQITMTLVFLNSSLNPILYCWRMRRVRLAVLGTIKNICKSRN